MSRTRQVSWTSNYIELMAYNQQKQIHNIDNPFTDIMRITPVILVVI